MKCKDIQRWLIDLSEGNLEKDRLSQVEEHIAQCKECARLEEDLKKIRHLLKQPQSADSAEDLFHQTRLMCHAALKASESKGIGILGFFRAASIPLPIWLAFGFIVVMTVIVMLPLLKELATDDPLSLQAVLTLSFIIQNAVMLFFAPLILRKYRGNRQRMNMT
jgi:anti-sigma factor RsiW